MGVLGSISGFRRTVRAPVNPMDKSTIFSIYPKSIKEYHYTIQPGVFSIPAGSFENPSCLIVGPSSWWKDIDDSQPILEIPNGSIQIADAIVKGYCSGILGCNMSNSMPGLFWYPGAWDSEDLKRSDKSKESIELNKLYLDAKRKQDNWFRALIDLADGLWAKSNGSPHAINDDMRMAAHEMSMLGKDWMQNMQMVENIKCVACGQPRNPKFPICSHCHQIIDRDLYNNLNLNEVAVNPFANKIA